jgi:hypothetical protein
MDICKTYDGVFVSNNDDDDDDGHSYNRLKKVGKYPTLGRS